MPLTHRKDLVYIRLGQSRAHGQFGGIHGWDPQRLQFVTLGMVPRTGPAEAAMRVDDRTRGAASAARLRFVETGKP